MGGSLLGALAGGYAQAAERERNRQFEAENQQRQNALGLTKILLENPAVPPEYKGHLIQYGMDVLHTPTGKKMPDFNKQVLSQLPQIGTPAQSSQVPIPSVNLSMPAQPPTPQGMGTGQQQSGPPSLTSSASAANGGPQAIAPPVPPPGVGGLPGAGMGLPVTGPTLPGGSQTVTQAPSPNYTPAGQFHFMSPQEQAMQQGQASMALFQAQVQGMRDAGFNDEQIAAKLGFKPDLHSVGPGTKLVTNTGKVVAEGGPPAAMLTKEKYAVDAGPGGEIRGIIDNTGSRPEHLSPEQAQQIPEAAKLLKDAQDALSAREKRVEMKEQRQLSRQMALQTSALNNAIQLGQVKDAEKAVGETRKTLTKLNEAANQDEARYNIMQKAYNDAQQNPENVGSFDAALLAFHMGMTVGQVKGMRSGVQQQQMHEKARSLGEDFEVALGKLENGQQLSDEQRANFLKLAQDKMELSRAQLNAARQSYQSSYNEYRQMGADVTGRKPKTSPKAPGAGGGELPPGWE